MASTYRSDLKTRSRTTFTTIDELRVEEGKERYFNERTLYFIVTATLFVLLKSLSPFGRSNLNFWSPSTLFNRHGRPCDRQVLTLFFKSAHLIPTVSTNAFHSINLFLFSTLPCSHQQHSSTTPYINQVQPTIP